MKLNTDYLNQLKSFNSFASQHGVNSKAIARLGGMLAGRVVTASSTDSVRGMFRWFRST